MIFKYDIRPCLNCGNKAKLKTETEQGSGYYILYVECTECGTRGRSCRSRINPADKDQLTAAVHRAIGLWNCQ